MIRFMTWLIVGSVCLQWFVNGFGLTLVLSIIGRTLFLLRFKMFSIKNKYGYIIWELVSLSLTTLWKIVWKDFSFDLNYKLLLIVYFVVIVTEYLEVTLNRVVELTEEQYKALTYQMDDEDDLVEESE